MKSIKIENISDTNKVPTVDFSCFNISDKMYDVIHKKLIINSNHLKYVTNRVQDLQSVYEAQYVRQYEPNNFIP